MSLEGFLGEPIGHVCTVVSQSTMKIKYYSVADLVRSNVDLKFFLYSRFFHGRKHGNALGSENISLVDDNVGELNSW